MSLSIHATTLPKQHPPESSLVFGRTFTDHMLTWEWISDPPSKGQTKGTWHPAVIQPYGPLQIDPASSCLHYAVECFEGMKAYKDNDGNVRLFRPTMNMRRFQKSAQRVMLPVRYITLHC
jgi:branched-chain amino acid aminotransferase